MTPPLSQRIDRRSPTTHERESCSPGARIARAVWQHWPTLAVLALAALLLAVYAAIFLPYLPSARGTVGHDYGLHFPSLLAGYYWFLENPVWTIPWFSPAQCGGFPYFADPNVGYYTIPQWLTFLVSPIEAVRCTLLLFAAIGFAGCYVLMRRGFEASRPAASLSATLFLFNGFFVYRVLIGHLTFHPFMLLPAVAAAILPPPRTHAMQYRTIAVRTVFAACCLAYMFHAGMIHAIPPALLAIAGILLMHAALFGWSREPWLGLGAAGLGALALSAGKLHAELALLGHFPRDHYPLPGIEGLGTTIALAFRTLFLEVPADAARHIVNSRWLMDRHEWEYGVSPVPLALILAGVTTGAMQAVRRGTWPQFGWGPALALAGLAVLLAAPLLLNWYVLEWNRFLKRLPFFAASSNLLRWFCAYIPVAVLVAGLVLDRLPLPRAIRGAGRSGLAGVGIIVAVGMQAHTDRGYYEQQPYAIAPIQAAWASASIQRSAQPIERIALGRSLDGTGPNDGMSRGISSILCYQPLMGYRLEMFPVGRLRPGPVFPPAPAGINLKQPACYLFPAENTCEPGDHFPPEAVAAAEDFVRYRAFPFHSPPQQSLATGLSVIALCASVAVTAIAGIGAIDAPRRRWRHLHDQGRRPARLGDPEAPLGRRPSLFALCGGHFLHFASKRSPLATALRSRRQSAVSKPAKTVAMNFRDLPDIDAMQTRRRRNASVPMKTMMWTLATLLSLLLTAALLLPPLPAGGRPQSPGSSGVGRMPICHRTSLARSTWQSVNLILSEVEWAVAHGDFVIDPTHPCPPPTTALPTTQPAIDDPQP